jgi:hypothetical protein
MRLAESAEKCDAQRVSSYSADKQLMSYDALGAHARDELVITETLPTHCAIESIVP